MHRVRTEGWNLVDHRGVFDAGDDPQRPAAGRTGVIGYILYPTASRQPSAVQIGSPADLSMSIANTRLSRCAQLIAVWRSTGVFCCSSSKALGWAPFPRFAGVTAARSPLLGANTP